MKINAKIFLTVASQLVIFFYTPSIAQSYNLFGIQYEFVDGDWYRFENEVQGDQVIPERILAKTNSSDTLTISQLENLDIQNILIGAGPFLEKWYLIEVDPSENPFSVATILEESELFSHIEFDGLGQLFSSPNDPLYSQQWNLDDNKLRMELSWQITKGVPSIVLAIINSGVEWTHEDLQANIWVNPGEIPGNGIDDDGNGEHTAKDLGISGRDNKFSHGRIDAYLALRSIELRPQNLTISIFNNNPVLSWTSVPNPPQLIMYKVFRGFVNNGNEPQQYDLIGTTTQNTFTDNNVIIGMLVNKHVRYRVSAVYQNENYNQGNGNLETGKSYYADIVASQVWLDKNLSSTWKEYGLETLNINKLVLQDGTLFAATDSAGLWKRNTLNQFSQWEFVGFSDTSSLPGPVLDLFLQKTNPTRLLLGLGHGDSSLTSVLYSTDYGITWKGLSNNGILPQEKGYARSVVGSHLYPDTLFLIPDGNLYRSIDGGFSWNLIRENSPVKVMLIPDSLNTSEIIWLREITDIFTYAASKSYNFGNNWIFLEPNGEGENWFLNVIERVKETSTLYAGGGQFSKSTDDGETWAVSIERNFLYAGILIDPGNPNHIITGGGRSLLNKTNLYETFDGGETWDTLYTFPDSQGLSALIWDPIRHLIFAGAKKNWGTPPDGMGGVFIWQLPTNTQDPSNASIQSYELFQNYPNPFNPNTVISYQLPVTSKVTIKLFDILGRKIKTLVDEEKTAGFHSINFDGSNLASGIYFYSISVNDFYQTKKMVLLR